MSNIKHRRYWSGKRRAKYTHCDHCGISECCSPLDCLTETMLKNVDCEHGQEYYEDLTIAWEFSRWVLRNARVLLKNTPDIFTFHNLIEKKFQNKRDLNLLTRLHDKWDWELADYKINSGGLRWADRNSNNWDQE